ncbi:putative dimethylaniline monooxygenase [Aspergillus steynii IBT 23096]|uniref:Putative dimethylaniline monooxygenase n=1 Tax=Aspergillus steynii IBT 23096 TaxID=1392250 RepID=A0A2I2FYT9_9EURO|nr:putative dimethylaniline monooxygenase [Aspergillus steynii IBT 23096]PLB45803.1 putative dimethylaniline monooxygenase [Aspergillus steynii IBT 23096]
MGPRYRRVAVIGTGPSGLSAVKALSDENVFDTIRVFERRDQVGGLWHYDPTPDPFPDPRASLPIRNEIPSKLPQFTGPVPEDTTARTAIYDTLDSNVGAAAMAFTHTAFPPVNSALSIKQFGHNNPSRPFRVVAGYLEDLFREYLPLVSFNTTVERVEKQGSKWTLTLRKSDQLYRGVPRDYWWQEHFDAVVVASGHYNVPLIPDIPGLDAAYQAHPGNFEHSKAFRSQNDYVEKKVVVVGGNISSADIVADLHRVVKGPLYLSQRGYNEALESVWNIPGVEKKPTISKIEATPSSITVKFSDGSTVPDVDKIIFATGYKLSYPFLTPDPVTPNNRVAGFYKHVFKIGDPSLALVGQVRAAISFRVYEYQAVAVARYFAGTNAKDLPSEKEQDLWELEHLKYKGPTALFHEIKPDFKDYFDFLRDLAGPPAQGSTGYELLPWEDSWAEKGFAILQHKDAYWKSLARDAEVSAKVRARL